MSELSEIIGKRSTPGILIFDMRNRLLYSNGEALEMVPELQKMPQRGKKPNIPREIFDLCNQLKANRETKGAGQGIQFPGALLPTPIGSPYSMRAFFIGREERKEPTHIMVLIEKITERHAVDFDKVKRQFELSRRELEVLRLLCQGLANREISERLFISEYTAKDHIKKIMRKLGVSTRSQIITSLNR